MDLLVVRHAIAEDREVFAETGKDDADRPLTEEGRRRFEKGARGLRRLVPAIGLLATSPLVRAIQTGEILREAFDLPGAKELRELEPDAPPEALLPFLRRHAARPLVAVVGHEPHLSHLASWLLAGKRGAFLALGKGGAALLAFGGEPKAGAAELRWLLAPSQLRRLR